MTNVWPSNLLFIFDVVRKASCWRLDGWAPPWRGGVAEDRPARSRRLSPPNPPAGVDRPESPQDADRRPEAAWDPDRPPPRRRTSFRHHFQLSIPNSAIFRTISPPPAREARQVHPSRIRRAKTERRLSCSSKMERASLSGGRKGGTDRWGNRFQRPACGPRFDGPFKLSND